MMVNVSASSSQSLRFRSGQDKELNMEFSALNYQVTTQHYGVRAANVCLRVRRMYQGGATCLLLFPDVN